MKDELITLETAKLAKEKGFNELVSKVYNDGILTKGITGEGKEVSNAEWGVRYCCSAPTQSLLQKWLREEYNLSVESSMNFEKGVAGYLGWVIRVKDDGFNRYPMKNQVYTYEEALEIGLQEALKLIKL